MGVWGLWPRPQMGSQGSSCQQLMGPLTNTIEEAGGAFNLALPPAGPPRAGQFRPGRQGWKPVSEDPQDRPRHLDSSSGGPGREEGVGAEC